VEPQKPSNILIRQRRTRVKFPLLAALQCLCRHPAALRRGSSSFDDYLPFIINKGILKLFPVFNLIIPYSLLQGYRIVLLMGEVRWGWQNICSPSPLSPPIKGGAVWYWIPRCLRRGSSLQEKYRIFAMLLQIDCWYLSGECLLLLRV